MTSEHYEEDGCEFGSPSDYNMADALSNGSNELVSQETNLNKNSNDDLNNSNESYLNNNEKSSINGGTTDGSSNDVNNNNNDSNGTNNSSNINNNNNNNNNNNLNSSDTGTANSHHYNQVSGNYSNNGNGNNGAQNDEKKDSNTSKVPSRFQSKRAPSSAVLQQNDEFEKRQIEKMNAVTQAVASQLYEKKEDSNETDKKETDVKDTKDTKDVKDVKDTKDETEAAAATAAAGGGTTTTTGDAATTTTTTTAGAGTGTAAATAAAAGASQVQTSLHPDIDRVISKLMTMTMRRSRKSKYITATQTDPKNMLTEKELENVCQQSRKIFMSQPMLIEIDAPIKIVGDIHGQYFDLLRLFELGGMPPDANYVFLGDYVDRGRNSLEVISLLLSFKIKYPLNFFLLRGNHECASINRIYGFFDECKRRYKSGVQLWKKFCDVFNCLPVAAVIDDKIFCMHGGLSPDLRNFDQIRKIRRPTDVPDSGLLCDLLWADPDKEQIGWGENDRGVSYTFGPDILAKFLRKHDMDLVCRAHQVVEDGYEFFGSRRLVTIFSAPNYCGEFDNAGAMMSVDDTLMCSFHILKPTFGQKGTRFYS